MGRGSVTHQHPRLVEQLVADYRAATLANADRAMPDHAVKLARDSAAITGADIAHLRAAGFDDGRYSTSVR